MKKPFIILLALIFNISVIQAQSSIHYQLSDEVICNPERGFYHAELTADLENLINYRLEENVSLIYYNFKLDDYISSNIPAWYLRKMYTEFAIIRQAGIKVIPRFTYTEKDTPPYGDAPIEIVLAQIAQLKPVLQDNADIIFAVQAGFIGTWGEWYYTDYYSTSPGNISEEQMGWRRDIVHALLDAIPHRMIQLRTPFFKINTIPIDDYTAITADEAYQDSPIARIAHHNDCFLASTSDWGTYQDITTEKAYLEEDSKYTVVGGETCNENYLSVCDNALYEMERFHWTYLNRDYHSGVFGQWLDGDCYTEIEKRLGYRYRLISAEISDESKPFGAVQIDLKLYNDGFANVTNSRDVKIILRNSVGEEYSYYAQTDPRFWSLQDTIRLNIMAGLPENISLGDYEMFLQLPDPMASLQNRTEYAIQLANEGIWEPETAYNSLIHTLSINTESSTETYEGGNFFTANNAIIQGDIHIIIDGQIEDWANVPSVYNSPSQNAQRMKVYNSADSLFFLINGTNLSNDWQLFLNTDESSNSGYLASDWQESGADFLIENGSLYSYFGDGHSWEWSFVQDIEMAENNQVKEFKVAASQLEDYTEKEILTLAFAENSNSFLPHQNEDFILFRKNTLTSPPAFVEAKTNANRVVVYWTAPTNTNGITAILQRSVNGGNYETIFSSIQAHQFAYSDLNVTEGNGYDYRVQFTDGRKYTSFTNATYIVVNGEGAEYVDIVLDGESDDWNLLEPLITANKDGMTALRFYNTSSDFYYSMQSEEINDYQIYISQNENAFQYKISNDSLFEYLENQWEFTKKVETVLSNIFMEAKLVYSDLFSADISGFYTYALLNGESLLQGNKKIFFLNYNTISTPENFQLVPSIDDPYGTIKIKWQFNSDVKGYTIQRSVGDSLHFENLVSLSNTTMYYLDHDLDSTTVYYYRMFSFRDIVRSSLTSVRWLIPSATSSLDEFETEMKLYPNPMNEHSRIELYSLAAQKLEIQVLDFNGKPLYQVFSGVVSGQKFISVYHPELPKGVYVIQLRGKKKVISRKLVVI